MITVTIGRFGVEYVKTFDSYKDAIRQLQSRYNNGDIGVKESHIIAGINARTNAHSPFWTVAQKRESMRQWQNLLAEHQ